MIQHLARYPRNCHAVRALLEESGPGPATVTHPPMYTKRMTARMDEPFVVFIIGMRINRYWKLHRWLPVFAAMPRMLLELRSQEDSGLLHSETTVNTRMIVMIQYWESFAQLREYARDVEQEHIPAWVDYNQSSGQSGDVGIFHETYLVDPDDYESVYNNMPAFGLGGAGFLTPAEGSLETAGKRINFADDQPAVTEDGVRRSDCRCPSS